MHTSSPEAEALVSTEDSNSTCGFCQTSIAGRHVADGLPVSLQTRKDLIKGNFRDTHFNWGSLLLGLGVLISVVGPVNTYIRTGRGSLSNSCDYQ